MPERVHSTLRRVLGCPATHVGNTLWMRPVPFAQLPREVGLALTQAATLREFAAGTEVFGHGDAVTSLHLIASGRAVARQQLSAQLWLTVNVIGPGEMFGEMGLFMDAPIRTAAVIAADDLTTFELARADFTELRRQHPSISDLFLRSLSERSAMLLRRLVEGQYLDRSVRVARRLLEVAAMETEGDDPTSVPLTSSDVAGLTGVFLDHINPVLADLVSLGLIHLEEERINLVDVARLRQHAGW